MAVYAPLALQLLWPNMWEVRHVGGRLHRGKTCLAPAGSILHLSISVPPRFSFLPLAQSPLIQPDHPGEPRTPGVLRPRPLRQASSSHSPVQKCSSVSSWCPGPFPAGRLPRRGVEESQAGSLNLSPEIPRVIASPSPRVIQSAAKNLTGSG